MTNSLGLGEVSSVSNSFSARDMTEQFLPGIKQFYQFGGHMCSYLLTRDIVRR